MATRKKKTKTTPVEETKPAPSFDDGWKAAKLDSLVHVLKYSVESGKSISITSHVAALILPCIEEEQAKYGSIKTKSWTLSPQWEQKGAKSVTGLLAIDKED